MENNKYKNLMSNIFIIVIIIFAIFVYRKYDYKGIVEKGKTKFSRDSSEKYDNSRSYKVENKISNDAMFYREISVIPNTPYRITCMVKTKRPLLLTVLKFARCTQAVVLRQW